MSGALYYPSWTLRDPILVAEFLMYWDRLQRSGAPSETKDIICDFDKKLCDARKKLIKELKWAGVDAVFSMEGAIALLSEGMGSSLRLTLVVN